MTAANPEKLYTSDILSLAVEVAQYPFDGTAAVQSDVRSRSCGSTLSLSIEVNGDGGVETVGMRVLACAVGQAAAAIFARDVKGRTRDDLQRQAEALLSWLNRGGPQPQWAGIELLDTARAYPARHDAVLLPWRAALQALSKTGVQR